VNICGALGNSDWIGSGDEPACMFHGPNDQTVPYGSATLSLFGFPVTAVDGSFALNEKMNQVGVQNCFEIYEGQDHVPHLGSPAYYDTTLSIMTQFLAQQICDYNFNCEYNPIVTNQTELESLFIQIKTPLQSFDYSIYNSLGIACVASKDNRAQTSISTASLAPGVYFIEIKSKQYRAKQRFIKE
jgi:hypothetical protein